MRIPVEGEIVGVSCENSIPAVEVTGREPQENSPAKVVRLGIFRDEEIVRGEPEQGQEEYLRWDDAKHKEHGRFETVEPLRAVWVVVEFLA